jgi:hypothetical protein
VSTTSSILQLSSNNNSILFHPPTTQSREIQDLAHIRTTEDPADLLLSTQFQSSCDHLAIKSIDEGNLANAFAAYSLSAQLIAFDKRHPLYHLDEEIIKGKSRQKDPMFGAYFSGFGGGIVKGGHIHADLRNIEGFSIYYLQFKLNPFAREELKTLLNQIQENKTFFDQAFSDVFKEEVQISPIEYRFRERNNQGIYPTQQQRHFEKAMRVEFRGLGNVIIGDTLSMGCLYNTVEVENVILATSTYIQYPFCSTSQF